MAINVFNICPFKCSEVSSTLVIDLCGSGWGEYIFISSQLQKISLPSGVGIRLQSCVPVGHCWKFGGLTKFVCCIQAGVADITAALRNYRPSQTVLEAEVAAPRRGGFAVPPGPLGADDSRGNVMRQKRRRHDGTIHVISFFQLHRPQLCNLLH